jgi:hypothetical protein
MPRRASLVAAALIALTAACLALPRAAHADWQRGVSYTGYTAGAYGAAASDASLTRVAQDGNSDVSIVVTVDMSSPYSSSVAPSASTPTDASLLHAMSTARSLGLRVTLKPQIDLDTGSWRGAIAPVNTSAWFAGYEQLIDHYADLARQGGASMFVVGTELKSMTKPAYTARWQQLIAGVKQRFGGLLTYAANYDEFTQVGFWQALDYIGVDGYWSLGSANDQPVAALVSAWQQRGYVGALARAAAATGKQVIFTEIGYRSIAGATKQPNQWNSNAAYDMQEQANAYEAVYEAFATQPWFAGLYWWQWPAALPANGWNGDYAPTFKPAESVMDSWNARLAPCSVAAPIMRPPVVSQLVQKDKPATKRTHRHQTAKHKHAKHKRAKHKHKKRNHKKRHHKKRHHRKKRTC